MTPEEARRLLDGTTPGEWQWDETGNVAAVDGDGWEDVADYVSEEDAALITAAPDMAAMIAGMREEYAVQVLRSGEWKFSRDEDDFRWQDLAVQMVRTVRDHPGEETRIVRRYVTEPEEA